MLLDLKKKSKKPKDLSTTFCGRKVYSSEIHLSCGTENHFPHQILHFLYLTPGFPTSYNGLSKNITYVSSFLFILHLIRETPMPMERQFPIFKDTTHKDRARKGRSTMSSYTVTMFHNTVCSLRRSVSQIQCINAI